MSTKQLETYIKDYFSRPFFRRLEYLYTGFTSQDTFLFCNVADTDFKYCDPRQATGVVRIHDEERLVVLLEWLQSIIGDSIAVPGVLSFKQLLPLLNKTKWSLEDTPIVNRDSWLYIDQEEEKDVPLFKPIDSDYTLSRVKYIADMYTGVFLDSSVKHTNIDPVAPDQACQIFKIPGARVVEDQLLDPPCADFKLLSILGLDFVNYKHLIKKDKTGYEAGIRLWNDGPRCLNFGGFFKNDVISVGISRDNIFIFPLMESIDGGR